jgi:hypothetical protein
MICCVHREGRVRVYSGGANHWVGWLSEVVAMHCDWPVLAWINEDMKLRVYDVRHMTRTFSRLVPCVTYLCASAVCNIAFCGTKDGALYVCTRDWARELDVRLGGKPVRALATDGWGFVVVLVKSVSVGFMLRVLTAGKLQMGSSHRHRESKTGKCQDFAETFRAAQQTSSQWSRSCHHGRRTGSTLKIRDPQYGRVLMLNVQLGSSSLSVQRR